VLDRLVRRALCPVAGLIAGLRIARVNQAQRRVNPLGGRRADVARTIITVRARPKRAGWTREEVEREEAATRARVRRDAARGPSRNLADAVQHGEFAKRFAAAFIKRKR
jgi:hypothetical protein